LRIGFVFTPHLIGSPAGDDALIPERASLPLYLKTSAGGPPVIHQAQVNLDEPPKGPQEEDDSGPFEEQQLEIILSGFFSPQ
jgi:hypothetical protein